MSDSTKTGRFDLTAIAAALPKTAQTLLVDTYLTDRKAASARVFRDYRPTPPHYHATCDEYLYVLSGRGTFWMGDAGREAEFGPGELLFFERGTFTPCRHSWRNLWFSSRSIRRVAHLPISSSSIPPTVRPRLSWPAMLQRDERNLLPGERLQARNLINTM